MPRLLSFALTALTALLATPTLATTELTSGGYQQPDKPRDPFAAYGLPGETACAPGPSVVCTPLGRLKVKALVTGTSTPRAMLEDDAGHSVMVRVGDVVDGLQVKAIRRDGLVLERTMRDWQGRLLRSHIVMGL